MPRFFAIGRPSKTLSIARNELCSMQLNYVENVNSRTIYIYVDAAHGVTVWSQTCGSGEVFRRSAADDAQAGSSRSTGANTAIRSLSTRLRGLIRISTGTPLR